MRIYLELSYEYAASGNTGFVVCCLLSPLSSWPVDGFLEEVTG